MCKLCCLAATLIVLLFPFAAHTADRVSVQLLEQPGAVFPTTSPATPSASSLKDEKPALAIETIIDSNHAFLAECIVDGKTIHLSGTATPASDGTWQVDVKFSCDKPGDQLQVNTTLSLRPGERNQIGGFSNGGNARLVMLQITHEKE